MPKQRLTITLAESTLDKIDALIDKKHIRSRSHAIETILQKHTQPQINTAVILAGGSESPSQPVKPLIKFRDKPLIFHTLEHLQNYKINQIIVLANQAADEIESRVSSAFPQLKIEFISEKQPLGTAGALKHAQQYLSNSFFCLHSDIYTNINLQQMANFHKRNQALATLAVKPRMSHQSFDNISMQGNQITHFHPKTKNQEVSLVNSGVYLFEPELLSYIPDKIPATLEKDVFPQLSSSGRLYAFTFQGIWLDVTTEPDYQQYLKTNKN